MPSEPRGNIFRGTLVRGLTRPKNLRVIGLLKDELKLNTYITFETSSVGSKEDVGAEFGQFDRPFRVIPFATENMEKIFARSRPERRVAGMG